MVCLRPAGQQDLAKIFALDKRCFRAGIAYSPQEFSAILASRWCVSMVAESEAGHVLGLWSLESYTRKKTAHILTMEVAPEVRRSGLGSLLMSHLEQTALALGLTMVELEVADDDASALNFYLRLGYRATGKMPRYYLGKIDALRMEKLFTA